MQIFDKLFKNRFASPSKGIVDSKHYRTKNFAGVTDPEKHLTKGRKELYEMIEQEEVDTSKS